MKTQTGLGLVCAALSLVACSPSVYQDSATPTPGFGNSVQTNAAVMIIDPMPMTAANTDLEMDGRRNGIAIERYRTGKVIPPREMRTSDVLSGSGTGMSGGAQ